MNSPVLYVKIKNCIGQKALISNIRVLLRKFLNQLCNFIHTGQMNEPIMKKYNVVLNALKDP